MDAQSFALSLLPVGICEGAVRCALYATLNECEERLVLNGYVLLSRQGLDDELNDPHGYAP